MNNDDLLDILQEVISFDPSKYPKEDVKSKEISEDDVKAFDNYKLCSIIASNRYLKINKKMEILCMQELSERRSRGDNFSFEDQIKSYYNSFAPIGTKVPEIVEIIKIFKKK